MDLCYPINVGFQLINDISSPIQFLSHVTFSPLERKNKSRVGEELIRCLRFMVLYLHDYRGCFLETILYHKIEIGGAERPKYHKNTHKNMLACNLFPLAIGPMSAQKCSKFPFLGPLVVQSFELSNRSTTLLQQNSCLYFYM